MQVTAISTTVDLATAATEVSYKFISLSNGCSSFETL